MSHPVRHLLVPGIVLAVLSLFAPFAAFAAPNTVTTWYGRVYAGDGLDANSAYLDNPQGFTTNSACSLTIADTLNFVIRRVDGATNVMSTVAGNGQYGSRSGPARSASFRAPNDVEIGSKGELYVVDAESSSIQLIRNGRVSTLRGGLRNPTGTAISGSTLYVSEAGKNRILALTVPNGASTKVVATITSPGKLAVLGGNLYVTNADSTKLSRVNIATGKVTTIKRGMTELEGVAVYQGKVYFVAGDRGMYNEIWVHDPATGKTRQLTRVVETEWYNHASDILFCKDHMYLLFSAGSSVFRLEPDGSNPLKIAGIHRYGDTDGAKNVAVLGRPKAMILSKDSQTLYLVENHRFKQIDLTTKKLSFIAGSPMDNWQDGVGNVARMSGPSQAALSPDGARLWFADKNNNRIRSLNISQARLETLTGAGAVNQFAGDKNGYAEGRACASQVKAVAGCAYFDRPTGIAISNDGTTLYVTDTNNNRIRSVDVATGTTRLLAGGSRGFRDGVGPAARLKSPGNLLLSRDGKTLYVVDIGNHAIRAINLATKRVTTLVGKGRAGYREGRFSQAVLSYPDSLAYGSTSTTLYLSEVGSQRIRILDLTRGETRLVAGSGKAGNKNGPAKQATFNTPRGLLLLNSHTLLVADQLNDLTRAIRVE